MTFLIIIIKALPRPTICNKTFNYNLIVPILGSSLYFQFKRAEILLCLIDWLLFNAKDFTLHSTITSLWLVYWSHKFVAVIILWVCHRPFIDTLVCKQWLLFQSTDFYETFSVFYNGYINGIVCADLYHIFNMNFLSLINMFRCI
jgi:hypothetical protein